jgi:hypothetical protein
LTGSTPSAFRAKSAENKLAFANYSLTQRTRARLRHVVPVDILNVSAPVTHEVVVTHAFQIESAGAALDGHFPHQTCLNQVSQIVIRGRSGRTWIDAIHGSKDFRGCRMPFVVAQKCHYGIALRRAAQPATLQRLFYR